MSTNEPLAAKLDRLANRIAAGDVTFFIGAGYSVDSERNTAGVLIARLIARFEAITELVCEDGNCSDAGVVSLCRKLRDGLRTTFWLNKDATGSIWGAAELKANFESLTRNYYPINDWMCSAFEELLEHSALLASLAPAISARENELLQKYLANDTFSNPERLDPPDFTAYDELKRLSGASRSERAVAGKALFLDTMGFTRQEIMAGEFLKGPLKSVVGSYGDRLRPRHSVLAWLALEGLMPSAVTTNYDLLLEGAYRVAGMDAITEDGRPGKDLPWSRRLPYFTPIGDATEFFSHGAGHGSTLIVKIHGCVRRYRAVHRNTEEWRSVLRTIVFTFREVQNWREDSWSRDYLQSLLRTRTIVFAGYSVTDQVIHDTFRSVYEEMARYRALQRGAVPDAAGGGTADQANAFIVDVAGKREFHVLELLRAATLAAGAKPTELTNHPNLLGFHFANKPEFPRLDELMQWIFHLTYRKLQSHALEAELRRVAYQLFGHPVREADAERILTAFQHLIHSEQDRLATFAPEPFPEAGTCAKHRREFRNMTAWTSDFHRMLLREYAAADLLLRNPQAANRIYAALRWPWYAALNDHPDWGAWAVVIELAIRKSAAARAGLPDQWTDPGWWIDPASPDRPAVLVPLSAGAQGAAAPRRSISIEVAGLRSMSGMSGTPSSLKFLPGVVWSFGRHAVPWWNAVEARSDIAKDTPTAEILWKWAIHDSALDAPLDRDEFARFFGDDRGSSSRRTA